MKAPIKRRPKMDEPIQDSEGYKIIQHWFKSKGWYSFPFQEEVWQAYLEGKHGLLNAPTGSGKTFALWMPVLINWINKHPDDYQYRTINGLKLLWITPLRALTKDIQKSLQNVVDGLGIPWQVRIRTGDTSTAEKQQYKRSMPEVLITTPESMHVMLSQKDYAGLFKNLDTIVVDEWHELLGGKRGVLVELAMSRIRGLKPELISWCVSATVGNLEQALEVFLGSAFDKEKTVIVKAEIEKLLKVQSIIPDEMERFPWSGHLGLRLLPKILPIIESSKSTLIFLNTRGQTEIWYKALLDANPEFAGQIALHHGSLDREIRNWVEDAIHEERLKVVICTSSLDLGVDFAPVETVIQIGSPKGVSRFLQRAGRSGHRPGAQSNIYFLPTHALELIESAALQQAITEKYLEDKKPMKKPFDVLIQYMVTLAVSDGFDEIQLFKQVASTFAFKDITQDEWQWLLQFIANGGTTLREYDEFQKVEIIDGLYKVTRRRTAMQHRLSIGTIVSEPMMKVAFLRGKGLGHIEEFFISRMKAGDVFWFAGRALELVSVKEMTAFVRPSKKKNGVIPSWMGGRMSMSTQLSVMFRRQMDDYRHGRITNIEMETVKPLLDTQSLWSAIPDEDELLIEKIQSEDGYHLFMYPFAGRAVHEGFSALMAFRLSQRQPITFSIAMNDYGFELLSSEEADVEGAIKAGLFSTNYLHEDMMQSVNGTEMAKRKFREIAQISGLIFIGFPGKMKKDRHLQASSSLLFDVFSEHDKGNLLIEQAIEEVFSNQLDEDQQRNLLESIAKGKVNIQYPDRPTPFAFPLMVDRMREELSSEKLIDRIMKLQMELEDEAG